MSDSARPAYPSGLQGAVQRLEANKMRGWAFAPDHPDEHVGVEIRLDGEVVATTVASLQFDRLVGNGVGRGDHGFMVTTSVTLPIDEPERVEAIAVAASGQRLTLRLGKSIAVSKAEPAGASAASAMQAAAGIEDDADEDGPDDAPLGPVITGGFGFTGFDPSQHPVFVLGSARSGTSAMARALRRNTRYLGHGEGHLLDLFPKLLKIIDRHYTGRWKDAVSGSGTLIGQVPQRTMTDGLQGLFVQVARTVFPEGYWLDKTPGPEMIKAVPPLRRIWPEARFIFMKRRPIENIESRRRKFPSTSFAEHCQLWAESMVAWEAVRDELSDVNVEIEQLDMARQPEAVVEQVGMLLQLDAGERARLLQSFRHDRPERTTAEFAPTYDLETVGWNEQQRATFLRICDEPMRRFGYGTGACYMTEA